MITIKTEKEIEILKEGGKILSDVLKELANLAKPGISTGFLNKTAEEMISAHGAEPSFNGYKPAMSVKPYPAAVCASVNKTVVHGVPSDDVILKDGDVLKLDLGIKYRNLFTDAAITISIGKLSPENEKLIKITKEALELAVKEATPGKHIGDIGFVIENHAKKNGFRVIEMLVGHGVGYAVHEEPNIPNYGERGEGPELRAGMVLAIEPMLSSGNSEIRLARDGFGYETLDGSISAHFEHTVAVTEKEYAVLTK